LTVFFLGVLRVSKENRLNAEHVEIAEKEKRFLEPFTSKKLLDRSWFFP